MDVIYRTPVCFNTSSKEMVIGWWGCKPQSAVAACRDRLHVRVGHCTAGE